MEKGKFSRLGLLENHSGQQIRVETRNGVIELVMWGYDPGSETNRGVHLGQLYLFPDGTAKVVFLENEELK